MQQQIRATAAAQAEAVAALLEERLSEVATPQERAQICARFAAALSSHHRERDLLAALGLNTLHAGLGRTQWSVLSQTMPTLTALAALARVISRGSWRDVVAALPALAAGLPSLRSHSEFNQLVLTLPAALRETLAALLGWVTQADDALRPRLQVDPLTALAVAAVLWRVQQALPRPSLPQQGLDRFIAMLPQHWGQLTGMLRIGGALLAPPPPGRVAGHLTHVPSDAPRVQAAPLPAWEASTAPTSAASRMHDHSLMGIAVSMIGSGLLLIRQGWQMLAGDAPARIVPDPPAMTAPSTGTTSGPGEGLAGAIALLEDIVDVDGGGSIWQDLHQRLHEVDALEVDAPAAQVQARLLANDVADIVVAHLARDAAPEAAHTRARRAISDTDNRTAAAAADSALLREASEQLADAARALPSRPTHPEDVVTGNEGRVPVAMARLRLRAWANRNGTAVGTQDARLVSAVRNLEFAEKRLDQVDRWLPSLDRHVATLLTRQIRAATNATVEPDYIHRNIFSQYPTWPEWERQQKPAPNPDRFELYRPYPRDRRVRSGLVSSHTLVEAVFLPPEEDFARAGLYVSDEPGTYWPKEEIIRPSLEQFNAVIAGQDYIGSFRDSVDAFIASCRTNVTQPERDAYAEAMKQRLSGSGTLLEASGDLSEPAKWLLDTVLRYPAKFTGGQGALGRALALPGQDIRVHTLVAKPPQGGEVPLYGLLLVQSSPSPERSEGAVLVLAPSRQPMVQAFTSRHEALQQLRHDLPDHLHHWVSAHQHERWRSGDGPVMRGRPVDEDLLEALFVQEMSLRSLQLHHANLTSSAEARKDYLALDQRLRRRPVPVPLPLLEAALERVAGSINNPYEMAGAHWLAQAGSPARSLLRNVEVEDARWLASLGTLRDLLEASYPQPFGFVANRLEAAILSRYGVAINAEDYQLVRFSGGTPSRESPSGFVHDLSQKVSAVSLVELAFNKAIGYPDGQPGTYELGIYALDNSTTFDQGTEAGNLLPGQFLSVVRELDLATDYLAAVNTFWTQHRGDALVCLRSVYMFSAWQQYAEGSLSTQGLHMAIAATGYLVPAQAEQPDFVCKAAEGARISWISLYGRNSTLMRIENTAWPQVLLYSPGDAVAFREFSDIQQMQGWLGRVANTEQGRSWLQAAFDLADLQDGWFSNGVDTTLGKTHGDIFHGNASALLIEGDDLFQALIARLQQHARRDAEVLFSSNWEAWREYLLDRVAKFNLFTGLGSIVMPWMLPIAAAGSALELALGMEKAFDGRTEEDRKAGAESAGWGAFGVLLTAPFALVRTAGMSTRAGARVVPEVQEMTVLASADPLREVSARYAQPAGLVVDGARPADNGIYHYLGRHYIRQSGYVYEVAFDDANQTWRLRSPNPAGQYHAPVRLNADGLWEPHADVGLRGGQGPVAADPPSLTRSGSESRSSSSSGSASVSRSTSIESSYRGAIDAQSRLLSSSRSLDLPSRDFRWGMEHFGQVEMPAGVTESSSVRELKELFVSGELEAVQRGALSVVITQMERTQRLEYSLRMEEAVRDAVSNAGGKYFAVSQTLLNVRSGGTMGWCTGLSRMMAMAIGQGKEVDLIRNLQLAMRRPEQGIGAEILSHVRDAQGAALLPGATSAQTRIGFGEFARFLKGVRGSAQFLVTGSVHSMVLAVREEANGAQVFMHYCPTLGMTRFTSASRFHAWMRQLFTSRYFSSLQSAADGRWAETLAEMYGASRASVNAPPTLFMIRQVAPEKLLEQAQRRGWDRLLEYVPA